MKKAIFLMLLFSMFFGMATSAYAPDIYWEWKSTEWTHRFAGDDRIGTAIEVSNALFNEPAWVDININSWEDYLHENVIICRSDDYPDALAAAVLAGALDQREYGTQAIYQDDDNGAPILLNPGDELDSRVKDELERLFADDLGFKTKELDDDDQVIVVGGEGAISEDVVDELEDMGFDVVRIGGDDRYETAALMADEVESVHEMRYGDEFEGDEDYVLICTGENWPDALAAAAWGYWWEEAPILLVKKDEIPGATLDWLLAHKDLAAYVIGGEAVISEDVMLKLGYYMEGNVVRIAGDNRYETCVELAEHPELWNIPAEEVGGSNFVFVTGDNWPDALAACQFNRPILLTSSVDEAISDYLDDVDGSGDGYIVGGKGAIDKETEDEIAELMSDGDFEPTTEEPTINSFDVTINDAGGIDDIPDVAQYEGYESIDFDVETDEKIWNEDGVLWDKAVVMEDISELGGDIAPYNEEDVPFDYVSGDASSDNIFELVVDVTKKSTSPEQREVTFVARAENQAGSDTMESDSVEIYN